MNAITKPAATAVTSPGIVGAIAKAMGEIKRIGKDSRNVEQKYNFASVDDFLAMTGPICAANGLVAAMDEEDVADFERQGKYGPTHWLRIRFAITLMHASGESLAPVRRTVEVIRTGAQSFGSAQSYALKQYLRALFQIPTGDADDADYGEKSDGAPSAVQRQPEQRQERPAGPSKAVTEAVTYLGGADSLPDLVLRWSNLPKPVQAEREVIAAKDAAKLKLQPAPADLGGDSIPY
jgi:hypothetical protein